MSTETWELRGTLARAIIRARIEGKLEAGRLALEQIIHFREIPLTEEQKELIRDCTEPKQLHMWIGLALRVASATSIFKERDGPVPI